MSKWRPVETGCIYCIGDIHGQYEQLKLILNRILPLRKTGGSKDTLVFLGDYIDRRVESHKVLDLVMETKSDAPDQVVCIKGNHEMMLLTVLWENSTSQHYNMWMHNGGEQSMIGYLERAGSEITNPYQIPRKNIDRFIPKEHVSFLKYLVPYYETEKFVFVHGGCDTTYPVSQQNPAILAWDRSVYQRAIQLKASKTPCPWDKTIVVGHTGDPSGKPFIHDRFIMLDCSPANILCVMELNSEIIFYAEKDNKRLVKMEVSK